MEIIRNFEGVGGLKGHIFKGNYKAKLGFPVGRGGGFKPQTLNGDVYFLEQRIQKLLQKFPPQTRTFAVQCYMM